MHPVILDSFVGVATRRPLRPLLTNKGWWQGILPLRTHTPLYEGRTLPFASGRPRAQLPSVYKNTHSGEENEKLHALYGAAQKTGARVEQEVGRLCVLLLMARQGRSREDGCVVSVMGGV